MAPRKRPAEELGFYIEHFTRGEIADLDRALGQSLSGEIGMLRVVMRRFFERTAEEASDFDGLTKALNVLGLSCSRLASLVKTEQSLQDTQADELGEALSRSLAAVLEELNHTSLQTSKGGEFDGR
jgi:hypothetical protein